MEQNELLYDTMLYMVMKLYLSGSLLKFTMVSTYYVEISQCLISLDVHVTQG
jgi:hypothetical protein